MKKKWKKKIAKITEIKGWSFEKLNKIGKHLARLIKGNREKIQSTKL